MEKKEWEKQMREKINDNRNISEYLDDVNALDENSWTMKGLLCKMTFIFDVSKRQKNSNLRSLIILGICYIIGVILMTTSEGGNAFIGLLLAGGASAWKFWNWGDEVDQYNDRTGNVSYTARTNMFGEVKVEKDSGNAGCIMAIIGLVLGVIVTPILFIRSLLRFIKANKAFTIAKEIVEEMENELKVRFTWDNKKNKWNESVL